MNRKPYQLLEVFCMMHLTVYKIYPLKYDVAMCSKMGGNLKKLKPEKSIFQNYRIF